MPWSLIGISDEARRRIRIAAAESGQTIGQWLNGRILAAATARAAESGDTTSHTESPTREILMRMDRILTASEDLSAAEITAFATALNELAIRIEDLEIPADSGVEVDIPPE